MIKEFLVDDERDEFLPVQEDYMGKVLYNLDSGESQDDSIANFILFL